MKKIISKIDWYIIKKFLGTYVFAIVLVISIAVVFDYIEKMDRFSQHNAPWTAIVFDYYFNFVPYFANLFSALFVFIAVIFFTTKLAENSEIIAMLSTGMSFNRLLKPYMISAAVIGLSTFILGGYVIPKGSAARLEFEDQYYKKRKNSNAHQIQLQVEDGVIVYIERYTDYNKTGYRFMMDRFEDKSLVSHLTARSVEYDTTEAYKWKIKDYTIREFKGLKENVTKGDVIDTIIRMSPDDFLSFKNKQEMMTNPELSKFINQQKKRGVANVKEFEIEYHKRIAMSFAAFILTIIGVSLSSRKSKRGMGLYLGIGLALSFSYILFQTISGTFAISGKTSPMLAMWIPNILYIFIAFYLYRKAPR